MQSMVTLKEILELNQTVTLLELYVRKPDGNLIKYSIIGHPYKLSVQQEYDMSRGKLERIDESINVHGRPNKAGQSEITYGMIWKEIPKKYLDAEVTTLHWLRERYGNANGSVLNATIVPIQMEIDL